MRAVREYIVLCGQIYGGAGRPFTTEYSFNGKRFDAREDAIKHGFTIRRSDDFNIGVLDGGKLVSLDWMDEVLDTDPERLAKVAYSACLAEPS